MFGSSKGNKSSFMKKTHAPFFVTKMKNKKSCIIHVITKKKIFSYNKWSDVEGKKAI